MKDQLEIDEVMTPLEVAELLKIHVKTVYRLAREGVITGSRIGHSWRFSKSHIVSLLVRRKANGPGGNAQQG